VAGAAAAAAVTPGIDPGSVASIDAAASASGPSTPDGASYIAVCLPAFAPDTVHRDDG